MSYLRPAFPSTHVHQETGKLDEQFLGITDRDYFAAAALQGLLADPAVAGSKASIAEHCYDYADAMLEARKKS